VQAILAGVEGLNRGLHSVQLGDGRPCQEDVGARHCGGEWPRSWLPGPIRSCVFVDWRSGHPRFSTGSSIWTGLGGQAVMIFFVLSGYLVGGNVLGSTSTANGPGFPTALKGFVRLWLSLFRHWPDLFCGTASGIIHAPGPMKALSTTCFERSAPWPSDSRKHFCLCRQCILSSDHHGCRCTAAIHSVDLATSLVLSPVPALAAGTTSEAG